jgi:hypothetical protein
MATNRLENILTQAKMLSPDELAQLVERATEMLEENQQPSPTKLRYASLFGAGRGSFDNPAEADHFVRNERDAWDE